MMSEGRRKKRGGRPTRKRQRAERWQDKVETCVSSPDPRFIHSSIHSANLAHPSNPVRLPIQLFTRASVRRSRLPACSVPVPSMDQTDRPVAGGLGGEWCTVQTVCSVQSTGVRIRASLWSLRVPMIYCNQESCWPEPTVQPGSGPGTGGSLGRPMLTTALCCF